MCGPCCWMCFVLVVCIGVRVRRTAPCGWFLALHAGNVWVYPWDGASIVTENGNVSLSAYTIRRRHLTMLATSPRWSPASSMHLTSGWEHSEPATQPALARCLDISAPWANTIALAARGHGWLATARTPRQPSASTGRQQELGRGRAASPFGAALRVAFAALAR